MDEWLISSFEIDMITMHSYPWLDADLNKLMKTKKNVHII